MNFHFIIIYRTMANFPDKWKVLNLLKFTWLRAIVFKSDLSMQFISFSGLMSSKSSDAFMPVSVWEPSRLNEVFVNTVITDDCKTAEGQLTQNKHGKLNSPSKRLWWLDATVPSKHCKITTLFLFRHNISRATKVLPAVVWLWFCIYDAAAPLLSSLAAFTILWWWTERKGIST